MLKKRRTQGVKRAILRLELKPRGAEVQLSVCILRGNREEKQRNEILFHHTVNKAESKSKKKYI